MARDMVFILALPMLIFFILGAIIFNSINGLILWVFAWGVALGVFVLFAIYVMLIKQMGLID